MLYLERLIIKTDWRLTMVQWGMVIEIEKCIGCQTCTASCKVNNKVVDDVFRTKVVDYEEGEYPSVNRTFLPAHCNQCDNPKCVSSCPADATWKTEEGVVTIDHDQCVGCKSCVVSCPYGARTYLDEDYEFDGDNAFDQRLEEENTLGTVTKCDFCYDKVKEATEEGHELSEDPEATPHCVNSCIADAKHFGDLDDPEDEVARMVENENVEPLHPERETGPNVYYKW